MFKITQRPASRQFVSLSLLAGLALSFCAGPLFAGARTSENDQTHQFWMQQGLFNYHQLFLGQRPKKPLNVILFIGDGMGPSTVTSARILEGQKKGLAGEENLLSFERFPYSAFSKTYNVNAQVPDSAGTITAMVTGSKTRIGVLSVGPEQPRGACAGASDFVLPTILEQAEDKGLATGVVTTTRITHATPAGLYAHVPERDWEADSNLTAAAKSEGCRDIAAQLINFSHGDGIDVILGGGRQQFMPNTLADPEYPNVLGKRTDQVDLIADWLKKGGPSAQYVWNKAQFDASAQQAGKLLGLFEPSHMRYESERKDDAAGEPSLTDMTEMAIKRLAAQKRGYFLMVEAGRIDHAHHEGLAGKALNDTVELSRAVAKARELSSVEDTLIIVTADHSHTLTMSGYPVRGNPILGKVMDIEVGGMALDDLGRPYTTLAYANGPGAWQTKDMPAAARPDLSDIDTEDLGFKVQAGVPLLNETHSGEDVGVYASGPMSQLVHGVMEQNVLYFIMKGALPVDGSERDRTQTPR